MPRRKRSRIILIESVKILLLLSIFCVLQNQILSVRYDIYGHRAGIALAESNRESGRGAARDEMEGTLQECAYELSQAKGDLERTLVRLDDKRDDLARLIDDRTRAMEGTILERLESERVEIDSTRLTLEAGTARLERLHAGMVRDPQEMKRRMIYPTVQLKGNGTVGSGVIVYSQLQPALEDQKPETYATFILTAYHVVLEVMGDSSEEGIVEEIHVIPGVETGALEVFTGKLVLFDRARDIALIRLNTARKFDSVAKLMPPSELDSVDVFSPAYAVGCPLGNRPLPTIGEISSKSKIVSDQVFWMLSAPTFFGNSGGGVYLAENCQMIGVSSMIYTYGKTNPTVVPHMGLFVPIDTIYRWLDSEGYAFLRESRSIPREMLWKLAYVEKGPQAPKKSDGRSAE